MSTTIAGDAVLPYEDAVADSTRCSASRCTSSSTPSRRCSAGAPRRSAPSPTRQVCPICLGLPGSLPVLNERAVESAVRIGLALNCTIADVVPVRAEELLLPRHAEELPDLAVRRADRATTAGSTSSSRTARPSGSQIERAHMEEDTGKSLHVGGATGRIHGADYSLVDYNRAGIPLIEIVTKPIAGTGERAPEVARAYVTALRDLLRGARRLRRPDGAGVAALRRQPLAARPTRRDAPLGTRTETKNVNSLRVGRAGRPLRDQPAGGDARGRRPRRPGDPALARGHRRHDVRAGRSPTPRTTATSPSPTWCRSRRRRAWVEQLRATLPEPPRERRAPAPGGLGLHRPRDARRRQRRRARAGRGDGRGRRAARPPRASGGRGELARRANAEGVELAALPVTPAQVAALARLVEQRAPSTTRWPARCSRACWRGRATPEQVVAARGLRRRLGRRRARCGRRRRDRREPGGRRQGPRRQGGGSRSTDRSGDEEHARPGGCR